MFITQTCVLLIAQFWPSVANHRSKIACSFVDSLRIEREESETVNAMASLSMVNNRSEVNISATVTKEKDQATEPMEES